MSESRYARWIITEPMAEEHGYEQKDGPDVMSAMAYLDGGVIEGAFRRSCLVYIPAGVDHCPMNVLRADRPIFHFSVGKTDKASARERGNANE